MGQVGCIKTRLAGRLACALLLLACVFSALSATAKEYSVQRISDEGRNAREPAIGDASLLAWTLSPEALDSAARITFFHGENDPVFPLPQVRRLAARLNAPVCVLPEDGHMVLLSRPDLMERVKRVIADQASPCG